MDMQAFLKEDQDPKIIEKLVPKINDLLLNQEAIAYIAIQKKPAANLLCTTLVATNKRLFYCEPANLGLTTDFHHFFWEEIKSVTFKEEFFGAKFICVPNEGENITTEYIPKVQARKLAQFASEQLIQIRNSNSGATSIVQIQAQPISLEQSIENTSIENVSVVVPVEDEITLRLQKLKSLFDKQSISNEEYEQKKAQILTEL